MLQWIKKLMRRTPAVTCPATIDGIRVKAILPLELADTQAIHDELTRRRREYLLVTFSDEGQSTMSYCGSHELLQGMGEDIHAHMQERYS